MASHTINGQVWGPGTVVSVYKGESQPAGQDTQPAGAAVTTGTVVGSSVTFTGLEEGRRYIAYASGVSRRFLVEADPFDARSLRTRVDALGDVEGQIAVVQEAPLNVMDPEFGAVGDASSDDTVAFESWAAKLSSSVYPERGAHGYVPPAIYSVARQVTITADNVRIDAGGAGNPIGNRNTNSNPQTGGALLYPASGFTDPYVLKVGLPGTPARTLTGCYLGNLGIDGSRLSAPVDGIFWQVAKGGGEHVYVAQMPGRGIVLDGNNSTVFPNGAWDNHFWDWTADTCVGNGWALIRGATDNMLVECVGKYSGGHGFYVDASSPSNRWTGGYSYNNTGKGIQADIAMHQKIVGVRCQDNNGGIYLVGTGVAGYLITGCTLRNCSYATDNTYDAINLSATSATTGGVLGANDFYVDQGNGNGSPPNYNRHRYLINIAANMRFVSIGPYGEGTSGAGGSFGTGAVNDLSTNTRIMGIGPSGYPEIKHTQNVRLLWRTGTPEGVVTAGVGSICFRLDGGAGTSMYVKESGAGNTGWVAK